MKEKLKMVRDFILLPFVLAGVTFGVVGESMVGFFDRHKKKMIAIGMVVLLLAGWILGTGLTIVQPQTVKVVRYPDRLDSNALILFERPMPIVNNTDGIAIRYTWPRIWYIPGIGKTDIGAKEESYSLKEPLAATAKVALFDVYDLTGDPADKDKVAYLVISGDFEVTNWERFLLELDPKFVEKEFKDKSRSELLAINIGMDIFGYNIDNWFAESASRTYLVEQFAKEYNLKTEQEIEYFIKVYRPWYWALGAMYFHYFEEEVLRNPFPNPFAMELAYKIVIAAKNEELINDISWKINLLEKQKKVFYEDLDSVVIKRAEAIVTAFKEYLKTQDIGWPVYEPQKEISDYLIKTQMKGAVYSPQELYAVRVLVGLEAEMDYLRERKDDLNQTAAMAGAFFKDLWLWHSKGNDSLWRLAIQNVLEGKSGLEPKDFYPWLKADGMEYLEEVAEFYQELGLFEKFGIKLNNITFAIEEVVEETPQQAPAK